MNLLSMLTSREDAPERGAPTERKRKSALPTSARLGLAIVGAYVLVALFAPFIARYGESQVFDTPYAPWSAEFPLGTDQLGRDVLTRLIYGARNTIGIAFGATCLSISVGSLLGMSIALAGGIVDQLVGRIIDIIMSIPSLILSLMILSLIGPSIPKLLILIAAIDAVYVTRLARAVSCNICQMDYLEAAKLRGERLPWIVTREILPNILPIMAVEFGLRFCFVFLTIASLSFLGVGIQPPAADWGSMVRESASLIGFAAFDIRAAITPLLPAVAIATLTIAVNLVVDAYVHLRSGVRDDW